MRIPLSLDHRLQSPEISIPPFLLPYLQRTPHIREVMYTIGSRLNPFNVAADMFPYVRVDQDINLTITTIKSLTIAAEKDDIPTVLEVGPGKRWSPLETAMYYQFPNGKKPLVIAVERNKISPRSKSVRFPENMIPNPSNQSLSLLFDGCDVRTMTTDDNPAQFHRVHFIAPSPHTLLRAFLSGGQLVRNQTGELIIVADKAFTHWQSEKLVEVAQGLQDIGFTQITLNTDISAYNVPLLTGVHDSRHFDPDRSDSVVDILVATQKLS